MPLTASLRLGPLLFPHNPYFNTIEIKLVGNWAILATSDKLRCVHVVLLLFFAKNARAAPVAPGLENKIYYYCTSNSRIIRQTFLPNWFKTS